MYKRFPAVSAKEKLRAFRHLPVWARLCHFLLLSSLVLAVVNGSSWQKDSEKAPEAGAKLSPALANPILSDYFLKQYYSTRGLPEPEEPSPEEAYWESPPQQPMDPMAERYVQWQITRFLADVSKETDGLRGALSESRDARLALRNAPDGAAAPRQAWKQALADVSQHAGKLLRLMGNILVDLETDRRFKGDATSAGPDLFEKQSALLEEEAEKALSGVKVLFLEPTNVVGIEELKGENVLAHLNRVEELSKEMSKAL